MKQKDIYLAKLDPIVGKEQAGIRPVVIISGDTMNTDFDICIICPITSKVKNYEACVLLRKSTLNNLNQDSEVLSFHVRTVSKDRFIKKIGEITDQQLEEVLIGLVDVLKY